MTQLQISQSLISATEMAIRTIDAAANDPKYGYSKKTAAAQKAAIRSL